MTVLEDVVPSSLTRVISKVANFRVIRQKYLPDTTRSVAPSGMVRLRIPDKSIIDLASLQMTATLNIVGAVGYADHLESLIDRLDFSCSTDPIVSISDYGSLWKTLSNCSHSDQAKRLRYAMNGGVGGKPGTYIVSGAAAGNVAAAIMQDDALLEISPEVAANTAVGGGAPFTNPVACYREKYNILDIGAYDVECSHFLGVSDLGKIDARMFPEFQLQLTMKGNNVIGGNATWTLDNISFYMDTIQLPKYTEAVMASLSASQPITLSYKRWVLSNHGSQAGTTNTIRMNVQTSCLDRVFLTLRKAVYTGVAQVVGNPPPHYTFCSSGTAAGATLSTVSCSLDGRNYPAYRLERRDFLSYSLNAIGHLKDEQYDLPCNSSNDYHTRKFWLCIPFSMGNASSDQLSGYSTNGTTSQLTLEMETAAALTNVDTWTTVLECTNLLTVQAGQVVRIQQ